MWHFLKLLTVLSGLYGFALIVRSTWLESTDPYDASGLAGALLLIGAFAAAAFIYEEEKKHNK